MTDFTFRPATAADLPALIAIFRAAIETVGPSHYDESQVAAWMAATNNERRFRRLTVEVDTVLAQDGTGPVGFASLGEEGYIIMLYVRPDRMRRGLAGRLLNALIEKARARGDTRLHTEASPFSRPVFERAGFVVEEVETIERRGATFDRFLMARTLAPDG